MKLPRLLALASSLTALVGCSTTPHEPTGAAPSVAAPPSHTLGPQSTDVAAPRLFTRAPLPVAREAAWTSQALNPGDALGASYAPVPSTHTDTLHFVAPGVRGTWSIPIDTTDGEAALFLSPQTGDRAQMDAALANLVVTDPAGARVNARQAKSATDTGGRAMSMIPLAGHPAGVYTVQALAPSAIGVAVEGRLAASPISLTLSPSGTQHLLGGEEYVDATLDEGGAPVLGAHLTSAVVSGESLASVAPVTFSEVGGGHYRAAVHPVFGEASAVGAYLVDVVADGTAPSGHAFSRHGRTGFHFAIPTARIVDVVGQRLVTDDAGLIAGLEVDVQVESTTLDRLEVSAKLTAVGADGAEHPVAAAFYGEGFQPGTRTVTLHFDAGHARLSGLEGDFMVRDLQVYSLGTNATFYREAAAHNHVFASIARAQLHHVLALTPAQEELVTEGVLHAD